MWQVLRAQVHLETPRVASVLGLEGKLNWSPTADASDAVYSFRAP